MGEHGESSGQGTQEIPTFQREHEGTGKNAGKKGDHHISGDKGQGDGYHGGQQGKHTETVRIGGGQGRVCGKQGAGNKNKSQDSGNIQPS